MERGHYDASIAPMNYHRMRRYRHDVNNFYAHGAHTTALTGIVLERFVDIRPITDEAYLRDSETTSMDSYAQRQCKRKILEMMRELNKRVVLFACDDSTMSMITVINSLWESNGRASMVEHMRTMIGNNGLSYDRRDVENVHSLSHFVESADHMACLSVTNGYGHPLMPVCPNRPHHKRPQKGVRVCAFYRNGMVNFGLSVHCFKVTCRRSANTTQFHTHTLLRMLPIFIAPSIYRTLFENILRSFTDTVCDIAIREPYIVYGAPQNKDTSSTHRRVECRYERGGHGASYDARASLCDIARRHSLSVCMHRITWRGDNED